MPGGKNRAKGVELATDDWPFLYLEKKGIPTHYRLFLLMVLGLSIASMFLLPKNERRLRLPYFFMGAGFFLIETSNVVKLALLYGSTWVVNMTVFSGILALILAANWTASKLRRDGYPVWFGLLFASCAVAYVLSPGSLLALESADIDVEQIKWVVLMVLFSQPGQELAYARMEDLVFEESTGSIH